MEGEKGGQDKDRCREHGGLTPFSVSVKQGLAHPDHFFVGGIYFRTASATKTGMRRVVRAWYSAYGG